jgi:hypothetical protein
MRTLVLPLVLFASTAYAQAPGEVQGPCPDADAYQRALVLHRSWQTKACLDEGSDDCAEQRTAVTQLTDLSQRCQAGEKVGPPPTTFTRAKPEGAAPTQRIFATFEGLVGITQPLADSHWSSSVHTSPAVGARFGIARGPYSLLASAELAFAQLGTTNQIIPVPTNEQTLRRWRFLAHFSYETRPMPNLAIDGRVGIGVDYVDASFNTSAGGAVPASFNESDVGLAVELAGAAWWRFGDAVELGGTLALPIAHHATTSGVASFQYTGYDLELLVGVRVTSSH